MPTQASENTFSDVQTAEVQTAGTVPEDPPAALVDAFTKWFDTVAAVTNAELAYKFNHPRAALPKGNPRPST